MISCHFSIWKLSIQGTCSCNVINLRHFMQLEFLNLFLNIRGVTADKSPSSAGQQSQMQNLDLFSVDSSLSCSLFHLVLFWFPLHRSYFCPGLMKGNLGQRLRLQEKLLDLCFYLFIYRSVFAFFFSSDMRLACSPRLQSRTEQHRPRLIRHTSSYLNDWRGQLSVFPKTT